VGTACTLHLLCCNSVHKVGGGGGAAAARNSEQRSCGGGGRKRREKLGKVTSLIEVLVKAVSWPPEMHRGNSPAPGTALPKCSSFPADIAEVASDASATETLALSAPAAKIVKANHRRTRSDVVCDFSFAPRHFVYTDAASIYSTENRAPYRNCANSSQSSSTAASPPRSYSNSTFSLRNLEVIDRFAHLHDQILSIVEKVGVTHAETLARTQVIQTIQHAVSGFDPAIAAEPFGSFCTGLSLSSSDVDIVLTPASASSSQIAPASQDSELSPCSPSVKFAGCSEDEVLRASGSASPDETDSEQLSERNWWEIPPPEPEANLEHDHCASNHPCHADVECLPSDPAVADGTFSFDDMAAVLQASHRVLNFRYIKTAKIPIIKLVVGHDVPGVDPISVDVTSAVSSPDAAHPPVAHSGIRVRDFVKLVLQDYPSIKPVVMLMKVILTKRGLSNPYRGGLGSYPLFIMVYYWSRFRSHSADSIKLGREGEEGALGRILMEFLKWASSMFSWETSVLDWQPSQHCADHVGHFLPVASPRVDITATKTAFNATVVIMDPLNPGTNVAAVGALCVLCVFFEF
jgi:hypothetical protein